MGIAKFQNGVFRLIVSLRHNADDSRLNEWKESFQHASQMLYDATLGQHSFGEVLVANNSMGAAEADCWLMENDGASASSHRFGQLGEHSTLMADERFKPFIILHEFSHYAYDVFDEYTGDGGRAECIGGTTANACIMESGWWDGDRFGNNGTGGLLVEGRVKHYCVPGNHDPDGNTRQDQRRNRSCWESMVVRFPSLIMPATPPPSISPGNVPAIQWTVLAQEQRFLLVIDRSGSMSGSKLEEAKAGCHWWIDNAPFGDLLGTVSFSTAADVDEPLSSLATESDRVSHHTAVDNWVAQGNTAIGDGLRKALEEIQRMGTRAATQVIILLTDGLQNRGEAIESVLTDIIDAGVRVYTIAVGPSIDQVRLNDVAVSTGGRFIRIDPALSEEEQSAAIRTTLEELSLEVRDNGGVVTSSEMSAEPGKTIRKTIEIEPMSDLATFLLSRQNSKDVVSMRLTDPAGKTYDMTSLRPGVRLIDSLYPYVAIKITKPKPGKWKVEIGASTKNKKKSNCQLIVGSENTKLAVSCGASKKRYKSDELVHVYIRAFAPLPITGVKIDAELIGPGNVVSKLKFVDNGTKGDEEANDGVYTVMFNAPLKQGTYRVSAFVTGTKESVQLAEVDTPGPRSVQKSNLKVPAFSRLVQTSFVVGKPPLK